MEELTDTQNIVVGCIAGSLQCLLDHPLISLKNMTQQNLPYSFKPQHLYRGLIADMFGLSSLTAIQFYGTGAIKHLMLKYKHKNASNYHEFDFTELTHNELLLSSFGGGLISGIAVCPWELIMVQQQRYGGTLLNTLHQITNKFGTQILARAMIPSMLREGIFTMGYLGIDPILEHYKFNNEQHKHAYMYDFGCAIMSGFIATTVSHPFDTIKTCMQGDLHQKEYKGVTHSFSYLYNTYGMKRIYKGFTFRCGCVVIAYFVFNRVMEFIAPKLYYKQFESIKETAI